MLGTPPPGATHLLLITDPANRIAESDETNNVRALAVLDLTARSLRWDAVRGGLTLQYGIAGTDLPVGQSADVALFWASGATWNDRIGDRINVSVPAQRIAGTYTVNVPGNRLANAPAGATHLLLVVDPRNDHSEGREDNNIVAVRDVAISIDQGVTGQLSNYSRTVISELLRTAGEASVRVSSLQRTPEEQAHIMFDNAFRLGVASQYRLYATAGDSVIRVYETMTRRLTRQQILANGTAIEQAMVRQIYTVGPQRVSRHCVEDPTQLQVIDIRPSSFGTAQARARFVQAARSDPRVSRFLGPADGDPAFHLEIPQL